MTSTQAPFADLSTSSIAHPVGRSLSFDARHQAHEVPLRLTPLGERIAALLNNKHASHGDDALPDPK